MQSSLFTMAESKREYNMSKVVDWFHNLPHVNISFVKVNATFSISSEDYIESLGITAAFPAFWLILTLLSFLIYFLVRCCQTNWKKKKSLKALKWTLFILSIFCCGGIAVGYYGNHQAHIGVDDVHSSVKNVSDTLSAVQNKTRTMENAIKFKINPDINKLRMIFSDEPKGTLAERALLQQAFQSLTSNITRCLTKIEDINKEIQTIKFEDVPKIIDQVESYRWPVTMALLGLFALFCIFLIIGVATSSRGLLICFSVFGLLSVVICWILVSAYLIGCIGGSDFCENPNPFINEQIKSSTEKDVVYYYINCRQSKILSPFAAGIKKTKRTVKDVRATLQTVSQLAQLVYGTSKPKVTKPLREISEETKVVLNDLSDLLLCDKVHKDYISAMNSLCTNVVEGLSYLLLSATISGLLFTILIWIASHTWIYIRKKRRTENLDEADPFLPPVNAMRRGRDTSSIVSGYSSVGRETYGTATRPRYAHTPPQTPHHTTYSSDGTAKHAFEDYPFNVQRRTSPPPSYEHLSNGVVKA